jgi:hypothetical protein
MTEAERATLAELERWYIEDGLADPRPRPPVEPRTVHYSELGELPRDQPGAANWNLYLRDVGRLLAEGNEGRWALVAGGQLAGVWDTREEADRVRADRFPNQDVLLKQIRERESVHFCGWNRVQWH